MDTHWGVRHAIISGGASGIGLAVAKALVADGSSVTILDLEIGQQIVEQIGAQRQSDAQNVLSFEVDIVDAPAVRKAVDEAVAKVGLPDFSLNCAGIQYATNFERIDDEAFARVINVNLLGSRNFAFAVLPHMQNGSQLAFLASMGGLIANYGYSAYSSSKFGVVGLAQVLRTEYAPLGIGISMICPPEVPTPMVEKEKQNEHPVQRKLKDSAGGVSLEKLVPYALDHAIIKKQFRVIPGATARFMYHLSRLLPVGVFNWYIDSVVAKTFKRHPEAPRR
jgi:NAD(P)-dependent dehydrogenase (short-subunit alcohol dehydrogenase family)